MRRFHFCSPLVSAMGARGGKVSKVSASSSGRAGPRALISAVGDSLILPSLLFLLVLVPLVSVVGQSNVRLEGTVFDAADGSPAPGVAVELLGSGQTTYSDRFGRFFFESIPPGSYSVRARLIGYTESAAEPVDLVPDVTSKITIRLDRNPHLIPGITVSGRPESESGGSVTIIEREAIDRPGVNDVGDVLESVPGVFIQRSGGSGGEVAITIRGCDPRQVLVLVDGQRINSPGSGQADLSSIALETIERITVRKGGGSAEFGSEALGGVVEMSTQRSAGSGPPTFSIRQERGSWGSRQGSATLVDPMRVAGGSSQFYFGDQRSNGDYDFTYTIEDTTGPGRRVNNHSRATTYQMSGTALLASASQVRYSIWLYRSERGLPGQAREQNQNAWREEDRTMIGLDGDHAVGWGRALSWALGFTRFDEHYLDRQSRPVSQFDARYVNDVLTGRLAHQADLFLKNQFDWGAEVRQEQLYHTDYLREQASSGRTRRTTWSAFARDRQNVSLPPALLLRELTLDLAMRWDRSLTKPEKTAPVFPYPARASSTLEQLSPKAGLTLRLNGPADIVLRGSVGQSFLLPAINSLFWQGDARSSGNPDLRPEHSIHREAGFDLEYQWPWLALTGGVTLFHNDIEDLVVWTQAGTQGVWQPVNLGKAKTTGHDDHLKIEMLNGGISLSYQNTITDARNLLDGHTRYNNVLTFTPHYVTRFAGQASVGPVEASYSIRQVGVRYTNEANTRWYGAYRVQDFACAVRTEFRQHWQIDLSYRIANVGDEQYVLIAQHPMPGREHTIGLSVSFSPAARTPQGR